MKDTKGAFIVIDGVDGSGKSTLIKNVAELINKRHGRTVHLTREPGGSPFAEEVRGMVLSPERAKTLSIDTVLMLFSAGRFDHLHKVILPALRRGEVVISDRYDSSTYAYQICAEDHPELRGVFFALQRAWNLIAKPAAYVLVDVSPEVARRRLSKRAEGQNEKLNHFDLKGSEFHASVRSAMREFSGMVAPCYLISGEGSPEEVAQEVYRVIEKYL